MPSNKTILQFGLFLLIITSFRHHSSAEHVQEPEQEDQPQQQQQHRLSLINWTTGEIQAVEPPDSSEIEGNFCKEEEKKANILMVVTANLAIVVLLLLLYTAYLLRELRKLKNANENCSKESSDAVDKAEKMSLKNMIFFKI